MRGDEERNFKRQVGKGDMIQGFRGLWGTWSVSQREEFPTSFGKSLKVSELSRLEWEGHFSAGELKVEQGPGGRMEGRGCWVGGRLSARPGGTVQTRGVAPCALLTPPPPLHLLTPPPASAAGLHIQHKQPDEESRGGPEGVRQTHILWVWRKRGLKDVEQAKGVRRP